MPTIHVSARTRKALNLAWRSGATIYPSTGPSLQATLDANPELRRTLVNVIPTENTFRAGVARLRAAARRPIVRRALGSTRAPRARHVRQAARAGAGGDDGPSSADPAPPPFHNLIFVSPLAVGAR